MPQTQTAASPCVHPPRLVLCSPPPFVRPHVSCDCLLPFACRYEAVCATVGGRPIVGRPSVFHEVKLEGLVAGGGVAQGEELKGKEQHQMPAPVPPTAVDSKCALHLWRNGIRCYNRLPHVCIHPLLMYTYTHCSYIHTPIIYVYIHPLFMCISIARHAACSCGHGPLFHRSDARVEQVPLQHRRVACDVQFASCDV